MLRELAAMKGDVIGFVNIDRKMQLGIKDEIQAYRGMLRRLGRKDRVIVPANADDTYAESADNETAVLIRRLDGYNFHEKFDIAACDGVVFVCRQTDKEIIVHRLKDPTTYDAYKKLLTDLWIAADNSTIGKGKDINYTVAELRALLTPYNVADAHTHQSHSDSQAAIVTSLPKLWRGSHYTNQAAIEQEFIQKFFELRHCPTAIRTGRNYINYSASAIIALISNFIRSNHVSVTLLSPCFDNLPDLLRDGGTLPIAIDENLLHEPDRIYERLGEQVKTDALFIVNPNNPTGFCLDEFGEAGFREVARYCRDHDKIFIADLCFMPFICRDPAFEHFDCYEILDEYEVDYITIEDTGKILPIVDTKAAILHVSPRLVAKFERLHTNYILRHSPFVLKIVTAFIDDAIATDLREAYDLFADNYEYLLEAIQKHELPLHIEKRKANLSIAWIHVRSKEITASDIQSAGQKAGVELLAGDKFFWDNPRKGSSYIRIALARDRSAFRATIDRLVEVIPQSPQT